MSEHSPGQGLAGFGKFDEQWGIPVFKAIVGELDTVTSDGTVNDATPLMGMLKHIMWMTHHAELVFPLATNLTVSLASHASPNVWSAWTEIVDSAAKTFSSIFAANNGHVTELVVEATDVASKRFMVEVAYGDTKIPVGSWRLISETNQVGVAQETSSNGDMIPAGETVYYRCMCETGAKAALAYFKYFLQT